MKNIAFIILSAVMVFNLSSCSDDDNNVEPDKGPVYRVTERIESTNDIADTKRIYDYNDDNQLVKIRIQRMVSNEWKADSEISFVYAGSKITVTKVGAFVKEYTLANGRVVSYKKDEVGSSRSEVSSFIYNSKGDLASFVDGETPFVVAYDSNDRFSGFTASVTALGETISLDASFTFSDDKIASMIINKTIAGNATLYSKADYEYSNGLLLKESLYSHDEDTNKIEAVPTVSNFTYDVNKCLSSYTISSGGVVDVKYDYSYEEASGNAALFEYLPNNMLIKKWTGGMIK